jgi:hypothetical protein
MQVRSRLFPHHHLLRAAKSPYHHVTPYGDGSGRGMKHVSICACISEAQVIQRPLCYINWGRDIVPRTRKCQHGLHTDFMYSLVYRLSRPTSLTPLTTSHFNFPARTKRSLPHRLLFIFAYQVHSFLSACLKTALFGSALPPSSSFKSPVGPWRLSISSSPENLA